MATPSQTLEELVGWEDDGRCNFQLAMASGKHGREHVDGITDF